MGATGRHAAAEHGVYALYDHESHTLSRPKAPEEHGPCRAGVGGIPVPEDVKVEGEAACRRWAEAQCMLTGWCPVGDWLEGPTRVLLRPMSGLERKMGEHIARMQRVITKVGNMAENMARYAEESGFSRDMANVHAEALLEALGTEYQAPRPEEASHG